MATIVKSIHYRDTRGRSYSPFSSYIPKDAVRVDAGFTIEWDNGTQGTGRPPFKTYEEAEAYLAKVPKGFRGF